MCTYKYISLLIYSCVLCYTAVTNTYVRVYLIYSLIDL